MPAPTTEELKPQSSATPKPEPKQPKWITHEEAEKLDRYIGRQFVPKGNAEFARKFFYKVESLFPYSVIHENPEPDKCRVKLVLQKYYRDKTEEATVATDTGARENITRNAKVESHKMTNNGIWVCIDPTANIPVDFELFKTEYVPDALVD